MPSVAELETAAQCAVANQNRGGARRSSTDDAAHMTLAVMSLVLTMKGESELASTLQARHTIINRAWQTNEMNGLKGGKKHVNKRRGDIGS